MDFIPELLESGGFNNVLVIVDKLTKYAIFIPTTVNITEKDTAELFFHHVISKFGIPRQVIWIEMFSGGEIFGKKYAALWE